MRSGRVVRFDESRGYGFIAPDSGGEDVFVHVNMLADDRWLFAPGAPVEFEAVDSDRGPKAVAVRVIGDAVSAAGIGTGAPQAASPPAAPVAHTTPAADQDGDDELCEVLSERELRAEITESLLSTAPDLTAAQLVAIRQVVLSVARRHGWTESD